MNPNLLKLDIQTLQTEALELLEQISSQMTLAGQNKWFKNNPANPYKEYQQQIENQKQLVENLELRMAIVAPMKAGKSTIINAIIGQEIVPSHNDAMTTLPTEIIFNNHLFQPILKLSENYCYQFQNTINNLQTKIQNLGIERALEIANYPHLQKLLEEIEQGYIISTETMGRESSIKTLTTLNHILRLVNQLAPDSNIIESLTDIPSIETSFWRTSQIQQLQTQGQLVIVDTPGPNEAGQGKLKYVVSTQLQQSSLVLIVLDFTQLRSISAAEVKQEVDKVIELRGKENLYILVNKVDVREEEEEEKYLNQEQVQQFVATNFGISGQERVFEISAKWAFLATNFMRELQENPDILPTKMKSAPALAKQIYGRKWKEELNNISIEKLKLEAELLWEDSGFYPFLNEVINVLIKQGIHRCMRNALEIGSNCLVKLFEELESYTNIKN